MSILEFQNVSFIRGEQTILTDASFQVEAGDFISIIGPSGSGKSTILKLCSHLISPTKGSIFFHGKKEETYDPMELRKQICYCFQTPFLFGNTVMENIEFPYQIRNEKPDQKRIDFLFEKFQMSTDYLNREVVHLSGGEKQRIALIRSLLYRPEILLLDEVTSALDQENTKIVEAAIQYLNQEGVTILWITHHPEQCRQYANKVLTVQAGHIQSFEEVAR